MSANKICLSGGDLVFKNDNTALATITVDASCNIDFGNKSIINVANSLNGTSAVNKNYVDNVFLTTVDLDSPQVLSNKTLVDATTIIQNVTDPTKKMKFDASSIPTGFTRTFTVPTTDTTLVGTDEIQTMTNKIISDSTNTVGANELRTTGASVNIDASGPPSTGDVLVATSATTAEWQAGGGGVSDHGALTGLTDDDHTQYALLTGRAGGQTFIGGIAASEILTFESTSNATKGAILFKDPLRVEDPGAGTNYVQVQAPTLGGNYTLTLPSDDGAAGEVLSTDGSGILSWVSNAGGGVTDHGALTGLTDDDHTQYALLAGRAGGQTLIGGTAGSETLTLESTSNATKGVILFKDPFRVEDPGVGTNYVQIQAPTLGGNYTLTLPIDDGVVGQVLSTDGSGILSWVTNAGGGVTDHGALTGLTDDDHTQYALLAGRAGGQTLIGGTSGSETLTLESTSNATKGNILFKDPVRFEDPAIGTNYVQIQAPTLGGNYTLTLPIDDGAAGEVLSTDGSGILSWVANAGATDHGALTGLTDDDHTQYALLAGRAGGQTFIGGTGSSEILTLESTSDASKGAILFKDPVRFEDPDAGTNYVQVQAPTTLTADYTLTLPIDNGMANQVLSTDGSGVLSWVNNTGVTDHGALTGLTDDDHTQYALLAGRAGGQTLIGGTAGSETLTFESTSNATKGVILFKDPVRFEDPAIGTNYVQIQAPTLAGNYTLTLPPDDGLVGESLVTDGTGVLSWSAIGASNTAHANDQLDIISTVDVVMTSGTGDDMEIIPGAGTYFVSFSTVYFSLVAGIDFQISIYGNGSVTAGSERNCIIDSNVARSRQRRCVHTHAIVTVADAQTIQARAQTNSVVDQASALQRSLIIVRLA